MKFRLFWKVYLHGMLMLGVLSVFLFWAGTVVRHHVRTGTPIPHVIHFGLVFGAIILILTLGSIPLVRQITGPLEKLTRAVVEFGKGDLTARAGVVASDEVGELARAFDDMATRIERLVRSQKEFLVNVSHELRTPLARVRVSLTGFQPAECLVTVVPGGVWQGSVLIDGGSWGLLGATMAPGFDYADYASGDRAELTAKYPAEAHMIERLTPGR